MFLFGTNLYLEAVNILFNFILTSVVLKQECGLLVHWFVNGVSVKVQGSADSALLAKWVDLGKEANVGVEGELEGCWTPSLSLHTVKIILTLQLKCFRFRKSSCSTKAAVSDVKVYVQAGKTQKWLSTDGVSRLSSHQFIQPSSSL